MLFNLQEILVHPSMCIDIYDKEKKYSVLV